MSFTLSETMPFTLSFYTQYLQKNSKHKDIIQFNFNTIAPHPPKLAKDFIFVFLESTIKKNSTVFSISLLAMWCPL